jgi:FixJ family two-component response regulator
MSKFTPIYVAIVDDDESICRSLGRLLRAAGLTYDSAESFLADPKRAQGSI